MHGAFDGARGAVSGLVGRTRSVCPVCLRALDAEKSVGGDGNIYLEKTCPEHGHFSALIWEGDRESYLAWGASDRGGSGVKSAAPSVRGCPRDCGLCAEHLTDGCCVLLELTNRCDLRCPVCFASAGERAPRDPTPAEIGALYDLLNARGGGFNIQLSGGEPTMRDDLPELIALGREKGFSFFQLNTNGLRIARETGYAQSLKAAGLGCVFLQFDGFDERVYTALRGRDILKEKIAAIDNCAAAGLPVVLVPVIAPGLNEDCIGDLLLFAMDRMPFVRGVHFQPLSRFGRCGVEGGSFRVTIPRMLREIERQSGGIFKAADFAGGGAENPYCSFHASYLRSPEGGFRPLGRGCGCGAVMPSQAREYVASRWGGAPDEGADAAMTDTSSLDDFLRRTRDNSFSVSGMLFQDAYTLDLERLRRCYICEADAERGMVPFCAYNLTDKDGRALYRR